MLAGFSIVGLMVLIIYKSGNVWNSGEHICLDDKPFGNVNSQLLKGTIDSTIHCWKGECKTKILVQSKILMNEFL